MKLLLFLLLILTPNEGEVGDVCSSDVTVYICTGPQSKKIQRIDLNFHEFLRGWTE